MSSQTLTAANVFVVLRQLRSLCYPIPSFASSQTIPSRAYSNYNAARHTSLVVPANIAIKQWHFAAAYSTAPPSKTAKESGEDTDLLEPTKPKPKKPVPAWAVQKNALKEKFKEGWKPRKKVSPDTMESIRKLHSMDSVKFSTKNLAEEFKISAEAIRRILKSKWRATEEEEIDRRNRWEKRKLRIQEQMMELGLRHTDPISKEGPSSDMESSHRNKSSSAIESLAGEYLSQSRGQESSPQKRRDPWDVTADDLPGTIRTSTRDAWPQERFPERRGSSQRRTRRDEYIERGPRGKPDW
ncbi:hypothetical protein MGYG_02218 [Nannizzia gypsea CBS 118893]|uniref:Required for respiratory growth protein 9, mitochondrial n=1 Tax=Arthroderma gypseum (strain ATCC MYA-4604 / CBS 118893) TaxID=535722 RepID=RRG9_ARTGP|nr:hypothetical protein MGYG_02218 [Nannizzia gypsea CBS 118893]E4UQC3.1 RecName: Full=Required for respiratory growth protein 9, mitochondrial; Flags: Precursor [Nannizzia gypsea CBS 118893]EFQ99204.1 hypothetical protein MGYG_02218 [Nannizzia gypsea CBS 118893]